MPYMWLKEEEAELIRKRRRVDTPNTHPAFDSARNVFVCDCGSENLAEVDRTYNLQQTHYTQILQCQECGTTYFGNVIPRTYQPEQERPAIKTEAPRREQSPKEEEEYIILPSIMTA